MTVFEVPTHGARDNSYATYWQGDTLLVLADRDAQFNRGLWLSAVRPGCPAETYKVPPPSGHGHGWGWPSICDRSGMCLFRGLAPAPGGRPWDRKPDPRSDLGPVLCLRHGGGHHRVRLDPLRVDPEDPDGMALVGGGETAVGEWLVACHRWRSCDNTSLWTPLGIQRRVKQAYRDAGKTGVIVYNRETTEIRVLDLGREVHRVEIRPDGLVAAAVLNDAVALFDVD
jgi:hypothetical protein